jgi:hypothetical protein
MEGRERNEKGACGNGRTRCAAYTHAFEFLFILGHVCMYVIGIICISRGEGTSGIFAFPQAFRPRWQSHHSENLSSRLMLMS